MRLSLTSPILSHLPNCILSCAFYQRIQNEIQSSHENTFLRAYGGEDALLLSSSPDDDLFLVTTVVLSLSGNIASGAGILEARFLDFKYGRKAALSGFKGLPLKV